MEHEPVSRDHSHLKLLLGGAIGLFVGSSIMYFGFGPKGILLEFLGMIAYLSGLLFLKVFKP